MMPNRVQEILQKIQKGFYGVWRHLGLIKYLLVAVVLTLLAAIVSVSIWARVKPIGEYRAQVETELRKRLGVDELKIKGLHWAVDWSSFSIGVRAQDVEYRDEARAVEGAVPNLLVVWSPLKLLTGSLTVRLDFDKSTWQMGERDAPGRPVKPVVSRFRGMKQPTFWEKRVDVVFAGEDVSIAVAVKNNDVVWFDRVNLEASLEGLRSHFTGHANADFAKSSALGKLSGTLELDWRGVFQYVDHNLVGLSIDEAKVNFSKSTIDGWGLYKSEHDPLVADFGVQVLINEEGEFTTVDVKGGKLKFADLNFAFDGDQKNASGSAFKWILENQQLNREKLPFQIIHQAAATGRVQAEGRVALSKGWDFSAMWSLRANGINLKAIELAQQFNPRSEGVIVFNLAFDGGYEEATLHSSGFQMKIDAEKALLISKDKTFTKPAGQSAQVQVQADIVGDKLTLKPSFFEWADFRADLKGQVENISDYLLRDAESAYQLEAHTGKVDISRIAPLLSFLRQNPVPSGILEFAGSVSGTVGKKSWREQLESRELAWRVDRFSLLDFRAGMDTGMWRPKEMGYYLDGILAADLSLRGRGRGYLVQSSNAQASVDVSDAEFVWADEFRKPAGVSGRLKLGLTSVPNRLEFKSSQLSLLDTTIDFSGVLNQGARSRIALSVQRPIDLSKWRASFRARPEVPLQGTVEPKLFLSLLTTPDQMDGGIDWRRVGVSGEMKFQNVRGLRGVLSEVDETSGTLRFAGGKIHSDRTSLRIGNHRLTVSGAMNPVGQRGEISFYDLAAAKRWDASLDIGAAKVHVAGLLKSLYPALKAGDQQRHSTSLAPSEWLDPPEIASLREWSLVKHVNLESRWNVKTLEIGAWTFHDANASLSSREGKVKYAVNRAKWLESSTVKGAGNWDLMPRGGASHGLPLSGTWTWNEAPIGEILSRWDVRDAKVLRGRFTGTQTYAVEKSSGVNDDRDFGKVNFDGTLRDADHSFLKLVRTSVDEVRRDLGLTGACFAPQWRGKFVAWTAGDAQLKVEDADWSGEGARLQWSMKALAGDPSVVVGYWTPTDACLGAPVAECWQSVRRAEPDLGRFVLNGKWDKLNLSWKQGVWAKVQECLRANVKTPEEKRAISANETQDAEALKTYLKKNVN